jgi:hypothetical protein
VVGVVVPHPHCSVRPHVPVVATMKQVVVVAGNEQHEVMEANALLVAVVEANALLVAEENGRHEMEEAWKD